MIRTATFRVIVAVVATVGYVVAVDEGTEVFKVAGPSVVMVIRDGATGSGVVVGKDRVVTNHHVADGMREGRVKSPGGKSWAITRVLASNETADLALLEVPDLDAPIIAYAPADTLAVGQKVWAIGSPLGLEATLTEGIISAFRNLDAPSQLGGTVGIQDAQVPGWVQTSAAISSGNSGGALVDRQGRLVGIPTWTMRRGQNLSMAVHVELVAAFVGNPSGFAVTLPQSPVEAENLDARMVTLRTLAMQTGLLVFRLAMLGNGTQASVQEATQLAVGTIRKALRESNATGSLKKTFAMLRSQAPQRIPQCIAVLRDTDMRLVAMADDAIDELVACAAVVAAEKIAAAEKAEKDDGPEAAFGILRDPSLTAALDAFPASGTVSAAITAIQSRQATKQWIALSGRINEAKGRLADLKDIHVESERIPRFTDPAYMAASTAVSETLTAAMSPLMADYRTAMDAMAAVVDQHQWGRLADARAGLKRIDEIGGGRMVPTVIRQRIGSPEPWVVSTETTKGIRVHRIAFGPVAQMEFIKLPSGVMLGRTEIPNDTEQAVMEKRGGDLSVGQRPWTTENPDQVVALTARLSRLSGLTVRVPTYAEISAAAAVELPIMDPDDMERLQTTTWNVRSAKSVLRAVGMSPANRMGFHDVIGNAAETTRDGDGPWMTCCGSVEEGISGVGAPVAWDRTKGPIGLRVVVVGPP